MLDGVTIGMTEKKDFLGEGLFVKIHAVFHVFLIITHVYQAVSL